ncbi:uncharacterized protein LOC143315088 [Chaetodon auriga]|uniref:uncharacterized protein LOC143315088 n=1 Tax=Chaetodon auriga TaxID=39042 RepID=UPI0040330430
MIERFCEQLPAIQAAVMDPRIKKQVEKEKLMEKLQSDDFKKAEEFVQLMHVLYTSTLCVSSEKSPTSGQILPILKKLECHYSIKTGDSAFARNIKEKIWTDLSTRYQDKEIQNFLEEATVMDPRFKLKMDNNDAIWDRLRSAAVAELLTEAEELPVPEDTQSCEGVDEEEGEEEGYTVPVKHPKTALEELFAEEEQDMQQVAPQETQNIDERLDLEIRMYRSLPAIPISSDPVLWWWQKRDTFPLPHDFAQAYLCAQASSTPSERVLHSRRYH